MSLRRGTLATDVNKAERREWYLETEARALEKVRAENKVFGDLEEEEWPSNKIERLRKEAEYAEALKNYELDPMRFKKPKELGKR